MKNNSEYNEPKKGILQQDRITLTISHLKRDIARAKAKLEKKQPPFGVDFGQKDIDRISKAYEELTGDRWLDEGREARALISEFESWVEQKR